jgi:predicted nucleic acid-binding protein
LIRDHVLGRVALAALTLLPYEVARAAVQARRRGRITDEQGQNILAVFEGPEIATRPVSWQQMLPLAVRYDRSAYDAAYLAPAEIAGEPLVTGDRRLYNAVREHADWVQWVGDYR